MKTYILNKLTQTTVWFGLVLILSTIIPADYQIILGILFMITDDKHIAGIFTGYCNIINQWLAELG